MYGLNKALYLTSLKSKIYKNTIKLNRITVALEGIAGSMALSNRSKDPYIESKLLEVKRKTIVANKNLGGI